ncbi:hypothetical protein WICPIJ_006266 [Wickerhamomyces pijperi]|uniref:Uncharacterized protein n=1 Tax=Wickerhamomyces pijperi TaxID=599730 RepID=A0A9P8Q2M1_WICPI|nr:hypothetical protein WICPIJ_006266 [Wickerhamomyces pijperi]
MIGPTSIGETAIFILSELPFFETSSFSSDFWTFSEPLPDFSKIQLSPRLKSLSIEMENLWALSNFFSVRIFNMNECKLDLKSVRISSQVKDSFSFNSSASLSLIPPS